MAKRTKAQRVRAAKEAWARRKAKAALDAAGIAKFAVVPQESVAGAVEIATPPVTVSVTKEGFDYFLGIANNGSLHRVRVSAETLRTLALDALRLV